MLEAVVGSVIGTGIVIGEGPSELVICAAPVVGGVLCICVDGCPDSITVATAGKIGAEG